MWKKYQEYLNHNINFKCSEVTKEILDTELTEKQLLLLDKRENMISIALIYIFFIGVISGFGLAFIYFKFGCVL